MPKTGEAYEYDPEVRECVRKIASVLNLQDGEYFVISRSVFVDGESAQRVGLRALLKSLLAGSNPPSNVIVFLSPDLPFANRQSLGKEVADAGGTVVLLEAGQDFKHAVNVKFNAYNLSAAAEPVEAALLPPFPSAPNTDAYERYKYSEAELDELIDAYKAGEDSESVVS